MVFHSVLFRIIIYFVCFMLSRYEPSEMLINVFETIDKIRSTLLAHKCSPQTLQVQTTGKQVPHAFCISNLY